MFLLPYPPPPASDSGDPVPFRQLLYAGAARQDKGFSLIVDLVELLAREGARTPITVQVSADHYGKVDAQTRSDIARLQATGYAALALTPQTLTPQEYSALFPGSICLQPYDRDEFRDRVSGVTLDALAHACPVIATTGTWSAELIKPFGAGVELHTMSAASLLEAARKIEQDYAAFQEQRESLLMLKLVVQSERSIVAGRGRPSIRGCSSRLWHSRATSPSC